MASKTEIAKWALDLVHQAPIGSYDEVGTVGDKVRLHYPQVVATLLEKYPLWFTERRSTLAAPASGSEDPYWGYAYTFPAGMMHLHRLEPAEKIVLREAIPFALRDELIYTNYLDPVAIYTTGDVEPGRFSALFADAVATHLAARLALSFRTGPYDPDQLSRMARERTQDAIARAASGITFRPMDIPSGYEQSHGDYADIDFDRDRRRY